MTASAAARSSRKGAAGCLSVIRAVVGSTTVTASTTSNSLARVALVAGAMIRSMFHFTSSAVNGLPLWNLTPFRRYRT